MTFRSWALARALALVGTLAALLTASTAFAAVLSGRVVDHATGHPIEGTRVRLRESGQAVRTDADGRFTFRSLAPGTWTVSVHHVAYADADRTVAMTGDTPLVFELRPALYRQGEVVVRSARSSADLRTLPYAAVTLGDDAMRDRAAIGAADAAAHLPGLALVRDGTWGTGLSIRGLGKNSVVALVDNTRIETSTEHAGTLPLVNVLDLERIEVMKGAGSVLFGSGSLGGAVQMVTRRAAFSDHTRASLEWNEAVSSVDDGVSHWAAIEHAGDRHALRVSGGLRRAAETMTPRGAVPHSQWHDASGNASLALRTIGRQTLTALWQRMQAGDTGIPGGSPFGATAAVRYTLARREMFGLEYVLPNPSSRVPLVTARASRTAIERDVELIQSPVVTVTPHATHTTWSGELEARLAPARGHLLIVGADLWQRTMDSHRERWLKALHREFVERPVPFGRFLSGGGYLQEEWNVVPERARVVIGGRYDRNRTTNDRTLNPEALYVNGVPQIPVPGQSVLWDARTTHDASWSASTGLHVALAKPLSASVLLATAFRSPTLEERFQYLDLGSSLHVGNPDLQPERSVSLNVGARLETERTRLQLDAFGNRLTNLVAETPGTFQSRAAFVKSNIGHARLYGFEGTAEQRLARRLVARASVACARGEDTKLHANLPQVAPLTGEAELAWDAPGSGTLRVVADAQHTQGNPAAGESATAGWTTWAVRFASVPVAVGGGSLQLHAGVENVFDRSYRLHLSTLRGLVKDEPGQDWTLSATFGW